MKLNLLLVIHNFYRVLTLLKRCTEFTCLLQFLTVLQGTVLYKSRIKSLEKVADDKRYLPKQILCRLIA